MNFYRLYRGEDSESNWAPLAIIMVVLVVAMGMGYLFWYGPSRSASEPVSRVIVNSPSAPASAPATTIVMPSTPGPAGETGATGKTGKSGIDGQDGAPGTPGAPPVDPNAPKPNEPPINDVKPLTNP